jgi:hypothetical protein
MSVRPRPRCPSGGVWRGLVMGIREVAVVFDGIFSDDRMLWNFRRGHDVTRGGILESFC